MKKCILFVNAVALLLASCEKKDITPEARQGFKSQDPSVLGVTRPDGPFKRCAAYEVLQKQIKTNPARGRMLEQMQTAISNLQQQRKGSGRGKDKLSIDVVVHIVLPDPSIITDAQIASQMAVLNEDFNRTNKELALPTVYLAGYNYNDLPVGNIRFNLKRVVRKETTVPFFFLDDGIKFSAAGGSDAIRPAILLNIWVGDLEGGFLGYAQFPGGPEVTDGLVIDYEAFGRSAIYPLASGYDLGRTATHEMGHWLNLFHIWGDSRCGDDLVADTPAHDGPNYGCGTIGSKSLCDKKPLEQWMNFMDYSYDPCMYMFTRNQKERMDLTIELARPAYFSTTGK